MKRYRVVESVSLHTGTVGLSEKQAARRSHRLSETSKRGVYKVESTIHFKAGEEIDIDSPDKTNIKLLERVDGNLVQFDENELAEVLLNIDANDLDQVTRQGYPRIDYVKSLLPFEVTSKQCRDIWETLGGTN